MAAYTQRQASYIASVGGQAHQFALETIGELEAEIERLRAELKAEKERNPLNAHELDVGEFYQE